MLLRRKDDESSDNGNLETSLRNFSVTFIPVEKEKSVRFTCLVLICFNIHNNGNSNNNNNNNNNNKYLPTDCWPHSICPLTQVKSHPTNLGVTCG